MDGHEALELVGNRLLVDGFADNIPNTAQGIGADGHHNRMARVLNIQTADKAVGGAHGNGADEVSGQVRLHLENEVDIASLRLGVNRQSVVNRRNLICREFHVHDRADDTNDATDCAFAGLELLS